ncbi:hypothetical protein [Halostagnicola sp. A-GB9-2]|uniref:hypothetical protein n=1 Tax=Halostagnicola sp. A-GB9-2 TaxID=3048066 RepID=UPI0024BFD6A5|nr:hypothetical protein [Halostagnicola sp. A-GB9-2]MDJ1433046.1 hypothetical protein [Halostagnicola sp. A-GB9-2]
MVTEINRIGVLSVVKIYTVISVVTAGVMGFPLVLLDLVIESGIGIGMYITLLIGAAVFGVVSGAIAPLIYNFISGTVGGVEVELSKI